MQIGDWKNEPDDPYKDKRKCKGQPDQMIIYGRGGLYDKGWPNGCLGCYYKGSFDYDKFEKMKSKFGPGSSYFEKEYHHYESQKGMRTGFIKKDLGLLTVELKAILLELTVLLIQIINGLEKKFLFMILMKKLKMTFILLDMKYGLIKMQSKAYKVLQHRIGN